MKQIFSKAAAIAVCVLLGNCASIVSKSNYPLQIDSNPNGADITVIDKKGNACFTGVTPATVKLKSGSGFFSQAEYQVKIKKEGYKEISIPVTSTIDGWYFANILFGGLIGMLIVDPATGAMWKLETENVNVTLDPIGRENASLFIYDVNDLSDELKAQMVPIKTE